MSNSWKCSLPSNRLFFGSEREDILSRPGSSPRCASESWRWQLPLNRPAGRGPVLSPPRTSNGLPHPPNATARWGHRCPTLLVWRPLPADAGSKFLSKNLHPPTREDSFGPKITSRRRGHPFLVANCLRHADRPQSMISGGQEFDVRSVAHPEFRCRVKRHEPDDGVNGSTHAIAERLIDPTPCIAKYSGPPRHGDLWPTNSCMTPLNPTTNPPPTCVKSGE